LDWARWPLAAGLSTGRTSPSHPRAWQRQEALRHRKNEDFADTGRNGHAANGGNADAGRNGHAAGGGNADAGRNAG